MRVGYPDSSKKPHRTFLGNCWEGVKIVIMVVVRIIILSECQQEVAVFCGFTKDESQLVHRVDE